MSCKTGKQYYATEKCAATAAVFYEGQRPDKLFWYPCSFCGGFHLTHVDRRGNENYYSQIKREIVDRNINANSRLHKPQPTLNRKEAVKARVKDTMTLRKEVIERENVEEIAEWNKEHPECVISLTKLKKDHKNMADIQRLNQIKDMLIKRGTLEEIINWNKQYPGFLISTKGFKP